MPTLEITNDGNHIIKTHIYGKHITYQLRGNGVTFLSQYGIEIGDKLSPKLLHELRERKLVFTNGSRVSETPSTSPTTAIPPQNPSRVDACASKNVSVPKSKNRREIENTGPSNCMKLIGSTKELNRSGTFFKQEDGQVHSYIQMRQGDSLVPDKTYCIIFYHQERHRIHIPSTIQTKYIGGWGLWEVWTFAMPKCVINKTIRRWGIRIGYPIGTM